MKYFFSYFKFFIFVSTLIFFINVYAQIPQWQWVVQAGGNTQELAEAITCDNQGNSYITGYFTSNATFESKTITSYGSEDIFIAKYNNTGGIEWAKHAGSKTGSSNNGEEGRSIVLDAEGNVYITGSFLSDAVFDTDTLHSTGSWDIFIAKYNNDGNLVWAKNAGGKYEDNGNAIALDNLGNVYVSGTFKYDAYFDNDSLHSDWSGQEVFFAKYDSNGDLIWVKKFSGPYSPHSTALCVDQQNNVYVTGGYTNRITFDATYSMEYQGGSNRIYVVKFDSSGAFKWARQAGGILYDYPTSIDTDTDGSVFVTGHFFLTAGFGSDTLTAMHDENNADIFLVKYDTAGTYQWVKQIEPTLGTARSITIDENGNAYICGLFTDSLIIEDETVHSYGGEDIFVAAYDNDGNYLWYNQAGGTSDGDEAEGIAYSGNGNLYLTGSIHSIVQFPPADTLDTGGGDKIFVAKLSDTPVYIGHKKVVNATISLSQNYPNPFNPSTVIRYSVRSIHESPVHVSLKIYDVLGREIKTLVDQKQSTGEHKIIFDAHNISSGVYIYKLKAGSFERSGKMILLH